MVTNMRRSDDALSAQPSILFASTSAFADMQPLRQRLAEATMDTVAAVSAGGNQACARTSDGRVKCWGIKLLGSLGLEDTNHRRDEPDEMGMNLPFVDLGLVPGVTVTRITTGEGHTCALASDGRVKCWGFNGFGRLGLGDTSTRGDQPGEMGTNLPFVDLGLDPGVTVVKMSPGYRHTCVLTSDDRVKCWGGNSDGQLGLGDTKSRGGLASQMGTGLPFVNLGLPVGEKPIDICASAFHMCAHTSSGHIKCWGRNAHGELGLGDTNDRGDQAGEMGTSLPFVSLGLNVTAAAISGSRYSNCALLVGGSVKCWGDNANGRLGLGDAFNRGDDLDEMGDNLATVEF